METLTKRNQTVQEKKKSGPWGWVVGIVLALISLVGIGVAFWYMGRRARELAKLRTKVEQDQVDQDQRAHEMRQEPSRRRREQLLRQMVHQEQAIQERQQALQLAQKAHAQRAARLKDLRAWEEINAT